MSSPLSNSQIPVSIEQAAILDGLPAHIALLAPDGTISTVNEPWRRFATENGLVQDNFCVGSNYLTTCDNASGDCSEEATAAATGIRGVLAGELDDFNLQYPCHSPDQQRWFQLLVTPVGEKGNSGAIVMHIDITERVCAQTNLHRSQELLQMASRISTLGAWQVTLPDETLIASDAVRKILEVPADFNLTLDAAISLYARKDQDRIWNAYRACRDKGKFSDLTAEVVTYKKNRIWVRVIGERIIEPDGTSIVQGALQDISTTKEMEASLAASESRFRELAERLTATFDSMTDALVTFDLDWRLSFLNKEAERLLQQDRDQVLGQTLHELFPGFAKSIFEPKFREALEHGKTTTFDVFYEPLNTLFAVRAYPSSIGLTVYFRDVTAEREKDLRLREQAALLDKAKDAIILRDLEHQVLYWSRGAEKIYGWKADEVVGNVIAKYLYADPAAFYAATEATIRNGEWTGQIEQITKKGESVTVDANWTLLRDDDGKPNSILAINTDISERKKLEANIYRTQRMESIGTLASGIAHDLNNLLAPIVMGVELLKGTAENTPMEKIVATIEASANRGTDLVKQVLSFAKGVDGARVPVNVLSIVKEVESIAHNTFPKNISFKTKIEPDLPMILGDPTQLNQVLLNLCVNARDAMPEGGHLIISATSVELPNPPPALGHEVNPGKYVRIDVADTGCGMSKACIDRIFEPFFTTKDLGRGTGLGLSTALGIIRSHNGFITVNSAAGEGSTFTVHMPVHDEPHAAETPGDEKNQPPLGEGQLILVVDDEEAILSITQQTLNSHGYRTMTAKDGAEAIALYAVHHLDISMVLTDMMMPIVDGPTLIATLYKINPKVRVVAVSGLHSNTHVAKAGILGVEHFLAKPYSANQLLGLVHTVLTQE